MTKIEIGTAFKTNYGSTEYHIERRKRIRLSDKKTIEKVYWIYENGIYIDHYENFGEAVYQMLIRAGKIHVDAVFRLTP